MDEVEVTNEAGDRGFSLLEVLIALVLLTVAMGTTIQLVLLTRRANASARSATYAASLATEKMEQLRVTGAVAGGGSIAYDEAGYVDAFDARGLPVSYSSPSTVFLRRWQIASLPAFPLDSRVLAVRVMALTGGVGPPSWPARRPDEVRLFDVVTRLE